MKNIILQHWNGPQDELTRLSLDNINTYAIHCSADHRVVTGDYLKGHSAPCQKLIMLSAEFDEYDNVVMMDADMFTRTGLTKNIFDEPGIGRHYGLQQNLRRNLCRKFPLLGDERYPYWGGSIYKLDRATRQRFRKLLVPHETIQFSNNYEDEGIMHRLAVLDRMPIDGNTYLDKDKWNKSSFEPDVADSYIVHIRPRVHKGQSLKQPKIENYNDLVERGIV